MVSRLIAPLVAAIAIGFIILFSIFALPPLLRDYQIIQLNKEISGSEAKMIVPDNSTTVYATWISRVENQNSSSSKNLFNVQFSYSLDSGATFSRPIVIANSTEFQDLQNLQIATKGDNLVYIVWNAGDVFFIRSDNNGQTFSDPVNLSDSSLRVRNPSLVASGDSIFVTWTGNTPERADGRIFFTASHDNGQTFSDAINLNNITTGNTTNPTTAAYSSTVAALSSSNRSVLLVSWTEYDAENDTEAPKLVYSTDGGKTFKPSSVPSVMNDHTYLIQSMQAKDSHIYLVLASNEGIFLARGTFEEGKLVFSEPVKFGENNTRSAMFVSPPQVNKMLFEGDDNIYILYMADFVEGGGKHYFTSSPDSGKTFAGPFRLFGDGFYYADMAANGDKVYLIRSGEIDQLDYSTTAMHLLVSTNGGETFGNVHDYDAEQNSTLSSPDIESAKEPNVIYLMWNEVSQNESKVLFTKVSN